MLWTITPLLTGVRTADQGMMTYQAGYGKQIWLPMWTFLLRRDGLAVLVDTGLDDFMTPAGFTEDTGLTPLYMEDALASQGLAPADVSMVVNTHLHDDHCGNNLVFPHARHLVQRAELEFMDHPHPIDGRYAPELMEGLDIEALDGEAEPAPGLKLIPSPGHTPGGQSVLAETASGLAIIPGMCSNAKNFPASGAAVCPGVHTDALTAYNSAQRIPKMGGIILPLHEPNLPPC
jgi:glyoxylase-like metal-dependent hydrolase (beta-lactamase superfamily II)